MNKLQREQKLGANPVLGANSVPGHWQIRIEPVIRSRVSDLHQNRFNPKSWTSAGGDPDQDFLQKQGKAGNLGQSRPKTANCK